MSRCDNLPSLAKPSLAPAACSLVCVLSYLAILAGCNQTEVLSSQATAKLVMVRWPDGTTSTTLASSEPHLVISQPAPPTN